MCVRLKKISYSKRIAIIEECCLLYIKAVKMSNLKELGTSASTFIRASKDFFRKIVFGAYIITISISFNDTYRVGTYVE